MTEKCPIWSTDATYEPSSADGQIVLSERAGGKYFITGTAFSILRNRTEDLPNKQKIVLSDWIFRQNLLGVVPHLSSSVLDWSSKAKMKTTSERAHGLMLAIKAHTSFIGEKIHWLSGYKTRDMPPVTFAASASIMIDEVQYLARYLTESGFISDWASPIGFQIEPKGYEFLDDAGTFNSENKQVFVAMWFSEDTDDFYQEGICKAIRDCGYTPFRIDEKNHNNKIDDEIISEIRKSKFIVADFTSGFTEDGTLIARGGVYYEAGFAQGLGLPVIWTCHENCINHIHFDTRQYNHIVWKDSKDLEKKLTDRINATIN